MGRYGAEIIQNAINSFQQPFLIRLDGILCQISAVES